MPVTNSALQQGSGGTKRRGSEPTTSSKPSGYSGSMGNGGNGTSTYATSSNGTGDASGGTQASEDMGQQQVPSASVMKMKAEVFEKDRENFLQMFEKPTQIYRFLSRRMIESPVFLQRNLSYMRSRMSRSHKSRNNFSIDSILERINDSKEGKKSGHISIASPRAGLGVLNFKGPIKFYNIIILGVTDGQLWLPETKARVDICIARISVKKRKDGAGAASKIFEKIVDVKIHSPTSPESSHEIDIPHLQKCPVVSIPAADCSIGTNGHTVRSYKLVFRVTIPKARLQYNKSEQESYNHLNNRNNNRSSDCTDEPKAKRRRSAPTTKDRENFIYDGDSTKSGSGGAGFTTGDPTDDLVIYMGTVSLYEMDTGDDKIREVDFDVQMKRATRGGNKIEAQRIRRDITWESLDEKNSKVLEQAKPAGKSAKLCVAVRTSSERPPPTMDPPRPLSCATIKDEEADSDDLPSTSLAKQEKQKSTRVIFQFLYGNNAQQMTESRDDLKCPWCSLNCIQLYSLMKHLKLCHPRFHFSFAPIPNGAKIDVSINDSYDGSYSGSAFDLVCQPPGEAFARNGPVKRTEVFSILVCRPKTNKESLQEFFECDEKDLDQRRTYITGHNRLYHHTSTCLPIHPREIDVDSEGEPDPEWLRVKTTMMIDEFTDVNEGEKELMKLWNLHVMKYNYVGDCQIPFAAKRFVELHGKEVIQKNLYRNFCLHLINLFDFGLLNTQGVHETISLLHSQMKESNSVPKHLIRQGANKSLKGNNHVTPGSNGLCNDIKLQKPLVPISNATGPKEMQLEKSVTTGKAGGMPIGTNTAIVLLTSKNGTSTATSNTASSVNVIKTKSNNSSSTIAALANCKKLEVKVQKIEERSSLAGSRNSNNSASK